MTEANAWREAARRFAERRDYGVWVCLNDLRREGIIAVWMFHKMVDRVRWHMGTRFYPPIDPCLAALWMALETER